MEEKIVENKKEGSSLPLFISSTLLSIASLLSISSLASNSIYIVCTRPTHHPGTTPTTQDPVFALNEQYSTGQSDPYG